MAQVHRLQTSRSSISGKDVPTSRPMHLVSVDAGGTARPAKENASANKEYRFNQLAQRYMPDLKRYAYWLTGDHFTAEDLLQNALLRAWQSMDKLQDPKAAKGWLLTIVRNEKNRLFSRKALSMADIPLDELVDGERGYDTSAEAFVLRQAIEQLPDKYRQPLVQLVIEGYSQKEIAIMTGLSPAGVGSRIFRAKEKLREQLRATG